MLHEGRRPGFIPGMGRSPGEGNGSPHQNFCLENSINRGGWQAAVHGVAKSQMQLSNLQLSFMSQSGKNGLFRNDTGKLCLPDCKNKSESLV